MTTSQNYLISIEQINAIASSGATSTILRILSDVRENHHVVQQAPVSFNLSLFENKIGLYLARHFPEWAMTKHMCHFNEIVELASECISQRESGP